MQPYRIVSARTIPRVCMSSTPTRTMFTTPFFPRFNSVGSDITPLFRLLDSAMADLVPSSRQPVRQTFTPRFDIREAGATYELQGELPGIERKDLDIEFLDERTLVIRGRTGTETNETNNESPEAVQSAKAVDDEAVNDNASEKAANYKKASVEEEEYVDAGAEREASEGAKTPSSPSAEAAPEPEAKKDTEPSFKYWVSERSVGEFERRFKFPERVNLDANAVKAILKDGILSVVVAKDATREPRRINIE